MTDQKLMVRSRYEECEMLPLWPNVKGTNGISKTHDSVKNTVPSIL